MDDDPSHIDASNVPFYDLSLIPLPVFQICFIENAQELKLDFYQCAALLCFKQFHSSLEAV